MPTPDKLNISSRSRASTSSSTCCVFSRVTSDSTAIASIFSERGPVRLTDSAYHCVARPEPAAAGTSNSVSNRLPSVKACKVSAAIRCACGL